MSGDDYGLGGESSYPALYEKTPDEGIVIPFEWASKLDGATISSASYELPDGLTNAASSNSGSRSQIRITGGDACNTYRVIGKIVASDGRALEQVKRVAVIEG